MNTEQVLATLWVLVNSPAAIAAIAGLVLFGLNKLYATKPGWAKFEGTIITAIKFAEKQIPDTTGTSGLDKLDAALKYVLKVYEETNGKRASAAVEAELKEGVQILHDKLDAAGMLEDA